jgi:hypothetical protein
MPLLQMLLWSLELAPLMVMDYRLWLAAVSALVLMLIPHFRSSDDPSPTGRRTSARVLLVLLIVPVLTLVAGLVLWKRWEDPSFVPLIPQRTSEAIVVGLVLLHVAIALGITWYRRPIRVAEAAAVIVSLVWAWSCGGVSTMAVTGNWL